MSENPEYFPESFPNAVVLGSAMKAKQAQLCFLQPLSFLILSR